MLLPGSQGLAWAVEISSEAPRKKGVHLNPCPLGGTVFSSRPGVAQCLAWGLPAQQAEDPRAVVSIYFPFSSFLE